MNGAVVWAVIINPGSSYSDYYVPWCSFLFSFQSGIPQLGVPELSYDVLNLSLQAAAIKTVKNVGLCIKLL